MLTKILIITLFIKFVFSQSTNFVYPQTFGNNKNNCIRILNHYKIDENCYWRLSGEVDYNYNHKNLYKSNGRECCCDISDCQTNNNSTRPMYSDECIFCLGLKCQKGIKNPNLIMF